MAIERVVPAASGLALPAQGGGVEGCLRIACHHHAGGAAGRELARQGRRPGEHQAGAGLLELGVDVRVGEGGAVAKCDGRAVVDRGEQRLPALE